MLQRTHVFFVLLFGSLLGTSATAATLDDFKRFAGQLQGRWTGEVTWVTDWEGFGKKGDKVPAVAEYRIVDNGNVVKLRVFAGTGSISGTIAYDSADEVIRVLWAGSAGAHAEEEVTPDGKDWKILGRGSKADGTPFTFEEKTSFSSDGGTMNWNTVWEFQGQQPTVDQTEWKRADKDERSSDNNEFQELKRKWTGRWIGDITAVIEQKADGIEVGDKSTSYRTVESAIDGTVIRDVICSGGVKIVILWYWDAESQQIRTTGIGSDGISHTAVVTKESPNRWIYKCSGSVADGQAIGGDLVMEFSKNGNRLNLTGQLTLGDEKLPAFNDVYRRIDVAESQSQATDVTQSAELPKAQNNLAQLEWMIGDWTIESDGKKQTMTCRWVNNKHFIECVAGNYRELIGWDLDRNAFTTWTFGTVGGYARLDWKKVGQDKWEWTGNPGWMTGSGKRMDYKATLEKINDNKSTLTGGFNPDDFGVATRKSSRQSQSIEQAERLHAYFEFFNGDWEINDGQDEMTIRDGAHAKSAMLIYKSGDVVSQEMYGYDPSDGTWCCEGVATTGRRHTVKFVTVPDRDTVKTGDQLTLVVRGHEVDGTSYEKSQTMVIETPDRFIIQDQTSTVGGKPAPLEKRVFVRVPR